MARDVHMLMARTLTEKPNPSSNRSSNCAKIRSPIPPQNMSHTFETVGGYLPMLLSPAPGKPHAVVV